MSDYDLVLTCICFDAASIDDMTDHLSRTGMDIDEWRAMLGEETLDHLAAFLGFVTGDEPGLRTDDEGLIDYFTSELRGEPCLYARPSGIEHVFVPTD